MKRICALLVFSVVLLTGCGARKAVLGSELFDNELLQSVVSIEYIGFDGNVTEITDDIYLKETVKILEQAEYVEKDTSEYTEGLYSFVIKSETKELKIGIGTDTVAVSGKQYNTKADLDPVVKAVTDK